MKFTIKCLHRQTLTALVIVLGFTTCAFADSIPETIEIQLPKTRYVVPAPEELTVIENTKKILSATDYQSFLQTRSDFLQKAAQGLQALKYGFGFGVVVKNYFQFRSEKKSVQKLVSESKNWITGDRDDLLLAIQRNENALSEKQQLLRDQSITQKADQVTASILNSLDRQLWEQSAIVAHANEFGIVAAVGVQAEGGTRATAKGWGGLTDIGISIGYNRDDKTLAIQIFHELESFKSTQMPMVAIGGALVKAGFYVANQNEELTARGSSFYPPMAPGFSTSTNHSFMAGFSSGLTWPPSPLEDMLTYSNQLSQTTLLRITFSPLTKGFVRIQSGALKQIYSLSLLSIKKVLQILRPSSLPTSAWCSSLF